MRRLSDRFISEYTLNFRPRRHGRFIVRRLSALLQVIRELAAPAKAARNCLRVLRRFRVFLIARGLSSLRNLLGPRVNTLHDHQRQLVDIDAEQVAKAQFDILSGRLLSLALDAQTAAVAAELVLEGYNGVLRLESFGTFAGALPSLVPPPLVNLLFSHVEVFGVSGPELLDAFTGPHGVLPELRTKQEELTLGFALALTVFVDFG